jgi:hypothetical protein
LDEGQLAAQKKYYIGKNRVGDERSQQVSVVVLSSRQVLD